MKRILILGSTGSIGINTLEVIKRFPDKFKAESLTANTNIDLLEQQINDFHPANVTVKNEAKAKELKKRIGNKCEVLSGDQGIIEITQNGKYEVLVSALVGFAGLAPTIEAVKLGKRIALANKETLVVAGEIITELAKKHHAEIIPVDSEHSAIFQCLVGENVSEIKKLILTASGGPFFNLDEMYLNDVTVAQALNHPNWNMGNKVTIDSATMMNKGLEVIEAYWLFNLLRENIEVVVHPQSIVHSMVEFIDGSIKAQLSTPDMKLPIQYALSYPERIESDFVTTNFPKLGQLTFFEPNFSKFKCLKLAYDALELGGTNPCILNAANEIAVDGFLKEKIKFNQIPDVINESLENIKNHTKLELDSIFECDQSTRKFAQSFINKEY
jgi:1-deoxy-D-xylulose-5-phosphate reductoisomerase